MTKLPCEFLVTFTQKVWYFVKSCYEHDEISYRIGDQAGVENRPLMWPTSLSISPLSSWYSLKFRYFEKATNILKKSPSLLELSTFRKTGRFFQFLWPFFNIRTLTSILDGTATCKKVTFPIHCGYWLNKTSRAINLATKPLV